MVPDQNLHSLVGVPRFAPSRILELAVFGVMEVPISILLKRKLPLQCHVWGPTSVLDGPSFPSQSNKIERVSRYI